MTVSKALLVRVDSRPGKEAEVEQFLRGALPIVQGEPDTMPWFAYRKGDRTFGIFDGFPNDAARQAHLSGGVGQALRVRADELFAKPPQIEQLDVLASKLPPAGPAALVTKGLLLTFKAKSGHEAQVEEFLRSAQPLVQDEPATTAWFAIRLGDGQYGIFDVFPDNGGRLAHLAGRVPRELAKHALSLLGSVPDPDLLDVLASKLPH